jgi:sec-independent protein translocase protein TatC
MIMPSKPSAIRGARVVGERYLRTKRQVNPEGRMPLMDHLRELRNRVVKVALAIVAGAAVSWAFYDRIWAFLQRPYCQAVTYCKVNVVGHSLIYNGVTDGFYLHVKVSIIAGAIITSPIWLYQLWAFVAPGLYSRERRWTYAFVGAAVPLFGIGCFFAYLAMSRGLQFFLSMSGGLTAFFTADSYLGYWVAMIIGFGLCFEVPLFLVILNLARVVTHERFRKWRRVILFLVFVGAGIASPSPDPLTMLLLGGTVAALVEVSELLIFLNDRRYARNHPDLYAGLSDDELAPLDQPETPERVDVDTTH